MCCACYNLREDGTVRRRKQSPFSSCSDYLKQSHLMLLNFNPRSLRLYASFPVQQSRQCVCLPCCSTKCCFACKLILIQFTLSCWVVQIAYCNKTAWVGGKKPNCCTWWDVTLLYANTLGEQNESCGLKSIVWLLFNFTSMEECHVFPDPC